MNTFTLPGTDIKAPEVVLGLMRIAELSDDAIRSLVGAAVDAGIDFLDHAPVYGAELHGCERRFGEALALSSSQRERLTIQTKCGINPTLGLFDFSYEYIMANVEGSLRALNTDYIDVLLLHRPDALVEPEEVARAFDDLHASGKVRHFGVSNHSRGQIKVLQTAVMQRIVANQIQLSVTHAHAVTQGLAINMGGLDQSIDRDNGVVDYCRAKDIALQAWSPFQAGFFTGPFLGSPDYPELNAYIGQLAGKYSVPPEAIAVAWILRHPAKWQVVLGTTRPDRVTAAAAGSGLSLTREEWYGLIKAAGWMVP